MLSKDINECTVNELFVVKMAMISELQERAGRYLRAVGYDFYKWEQLEVAQFTRGNVALVKIVASLERYKTLTAVSLEVPQVQFEALTSRAAKPA